MDTPIRKVSQHDIPTLKDVIDSSELFPSEMLDDMISGYFQNDNSPEIWLTYELDKKPVAIAYCAPEQMTEGTWNLYLIAVHNSAQGHGIGSKMMHYIEEVLREQKQRVLIVETSGLPEFERTRSFYDNCGYTREAVIRDFYEEGDDKVVFWKKLS